jgi:hypothetical protein
MYHTAIHYCDPPWGQGNIKYWQTITRKGSFDAMHDAKALEKAIVEALNAVN